MFCKNCGRQIPDNAAFCPGCGEKRSDGDTFADERSGVNIRNLPSYAKEIDRSGHAIDSDRKKFSLSDPERRKFSLSDSGRDKFSLSDSGRDKFSLSDKSRKGDDGGIVRLTSSREPAVQKKEPATPQKEPETPHGEPAVQKREPAAPQKEPVAPQRPPAGFVNPLKDSRETVFRSGGAPDTTGAGPAKDKTATSAQDTTAGDPESAVQPEQTPPRVPETGFEENDVPAGFVNPLKDAGLDIHLGSDGDRNQPAEDVGEINSPHLKFAVWMVILSCTCCNPITLILGIIAIVFALQVGTCSRSGNLGIAFQKAAVARVLCWITFGLLAVWISLLVAMLCLPMPEDHTEKKVIENNQTEQVEDENAERPAEQADDKNVEIPTEQNGGDVDHSAEQAAEVKIESVKPERHDVGRRILREILD